MKAVLKTPHSNRQWLIFISHTNLVMSRKESSHVSQVLWPKPKFSCLSSEYMVFIHQSIYFLTYVCIHSFIQQPCYSLFFALYLPWLAPGSAYAVASRRVSGHDFLEFTVQWCQYINMCLSDYLYMSYVILRHLFSESCFLICIRGLKQAWPFSHDEMRLNVNEVPDFKCKT